MSGSVQADLQSVSMRRPWGAIIAVLLLAVAFTSVIWLHQRQGPKVGGPFELVNAATGREVSDRDFRGKWLLIFFGYTHCPDVCPTTLSNIAEAMSQLGPLAERIQPLFITVDPERDTMPVLVDYTSAFDPRILGLYGSADQIASAAKAYRIYYAKRVIGDDYYMDHTATLHSSAPMGPIRRPSFRPLARRTPDAAADAAAVTAERLQADFSRIRKEMGG